MSDIIQKIRQDLLQNVDEKTKLTGHRFFREEVLIHGVKTAVVNNIGKARFAEIKDKSKGEIFDLCEELWKRPVSPATGRIISGNIMSPAIFRSLRDGWITTSPTGPPATLSATIPSARFSKCIRSFCQI